MSFVRGRGLAGLLSIVGAVLVVMGYDINQQTLDELQALAGTFISAAGGLLSWWSKAREKQRAIQAGGK
ncbi:MAG TPA: hypothetical protein DCZ95_12510 [Verrucomicrobia bacterium]|nr:hypothetical protein [Verrucomicrobiota bacterium]